MNVRETCELTAVRVALARLLVATPEPIALPKPTVRDGILAGIQRAVRTVMWGVHLRDRSLIAAFYGMRVVLKLFQPGHRIDVGMYPQFWLGDLQIRTPIGRFMCRGGTSDFDIVNPNHEKLVVQEIRNCLGKIPARSAVAIDIGAHIGKYSILSGRILRNEGTVVSVEPDPANFALLTRNLTLNGLQNVRGLNLGCWSSDGQRVLHQQVGDMGGHSFVDATRGDSILVPVRTLDGILDDHGIDHVDILKMDVQRAEAEVLRGARKSLESSTDATVFFEETGDPRTAESIRILHELGFAVRRLEDINYVAQR